MTLTEGKALRFLCAGFLTYTKMSNKRNFSITVTPVRNQRKPKVQDNESRQYAGKLLDLLDSPFLLSKLQTPDLFVSVVASAVKDLTR